MNIKITRSDLIHPLSLVSNVVEKRQTLPILANLYFNHENGKLNIIGTDLEVEMSVIANNAQGDNGSFSVSSRKIVDIVRMLGENAEISFKKEENTIAVSAGKSRYKLQTLNADEYPRIEMSNWEERFKISKKAFKKLIHKTSFSMAIKDVRYYLNGILLELEKNILRAIATDGHRLAQSEVDISLDIKETRQLILPRKAVSEINRFIDDGDDEVELLLEMNKNHLKISNGETVLVTKLIDGKFPEFGAVLKTPLNNIIAVDKSAFIDALNRVSILTTDRFKGVKIAINQNAICITANNPEKEEAEEEIEIDYSGDPFKTGYNVSYLTQVAQTIETDKIELHLEGNDGICILKQPDDEKSIWLVMPMRI